MPNTVIALKKSATPAAIPTNLANGELAINFADGKLFYKAANGTIAVISTGDVSGPSYGVVNANGTLLLSAISGDTFSILPGDFITVTGDPINDKITIGVNLTDLYDTTNASFEFANSLLTGPITDSFRLANQAGVIANAAFNKANAANVLAFNTGIGANSYANLVGRSGNAYANLVGTSSNNYAGFMANAANAYAASLTPDLSPAFNKANAAYTVANAAFDFANTLSSASGVQAGIIANAAFDKANSISFGAAGNAFTSIAVPGQNTISASANDTLNLSAGENINITTNSISKTVTISSQSIGANADYGWINLAFLTTTQNYGSI